MSTAGIRVQIGADPSGYVEATNRVVAQNERMGASIEKTASKHGHSLDRMQRKLEHKLLHAALFEGTGAIAGGIAELIEGSSELGKKMSKAMIDMTLIGKRCIEIEGQVALDMDALQTAVMLWLTNHYMNDENKCCYAFAKLFDDIKSAVTIIEDREEQENVCPRADWKVKVSFLGCPSPGWVDHYDSAATGPKPPDAAAEVRRSHHAAVRREWVSAHDHHQVGAVNVGNSNAKA
jgi:hypothetical protein